VDSLGVSAVQWSSSEGGGGVLDAELVGGSMVQGEAQAESEAKGKGGGLFGVGRVFGVFRSGSSDAENRVETYGGGSKAGSLAQWEKRKGGSSRRTLRIFIMTTKLFMREKKAIRMEKNGDEEGASRLRYAIARDAKQKLLNLGPTFIKLGQLLSTRVDLLQPEYIEVLATLQDNVPPFPSEIAVSVVEDELNGNIADLFDTFDPVPLAAASLGQVHRATLDGEELVVKVQRRGLKDLFESDLKVIRLMAHAMAAFDQQTDGTDRDWINMYDQQRRLLYREIEYIEEAKNCDLFRTNFEGTPWVKVPKIRWDRTTNQVVTMEYVPGVKISDKKKIEAMGVDPTLVAKRAHAAYMTQLCRHGFFHCDTHPGNVAVDAEEDGRLIYYDFGMMDHISDTIRKGFVKLVFGVYNNEPVPVCDGAQEMGIMKPDVDRQTMEFIAKNYLDAFAETLQGNSKWVNEMSEDEQKADRKQRRAKIGAELFFVAEDKPFVFPAAYTFVYRAFSTLDGIGKGLDKDFDMARLCQPFLVELVDLKDGNRWVTAADQVLKKVGLRPLDISQLVQQPRNVAADHEFLMDLREGRRQLRVRTFEAERQIAKLEVMQKMILTGVGLSAVFNFGMLLCLLPSAVGGVGTVNFGKYGKAVCWTAGIIAAAKLPKYWIRYRNIAGNGARTVVEKF